MRKTDDNVPAAAARMAAVRSPVIPIVGELIRAHPGTISLGQGVVHYPPPPAALEAIQLFLADPENHKYKAVEGIPQLQAAIETKLAAFNGIVAGSDRRIVVTAGGNMAFMHAIQAIADPGDEIILPSPFYFNHDMAICIAGCTTVAVPTDACCQPDIDAIARAITPRTRAVVTVSPNNPTGAVYSRDTLLQINALCANRGIFHVSDEAYEDFIFDGAWHYSPASAQAAGAHTISLFSLSKSYGFAAWRIGYMVIPEQLLMSVKKIQDTVLICAPVISQYAAAAAITAGRDYVKTQLAEMAVTRAAMLQELKTLRGLCDIVPAAGALYFYLRLKLPLNSMALIERLIREYSVAVIPGGTFGETQTCALRVSFGALKPETVQEGTSRLVQGLLKLA